VQVDDLRDICAGASIAHAITLVLQPGNLGAPAAGPTGPVRQPGPAGGSEAASVGRYISHELWNQMFPYQAGPNIPPACNGRELFSYEAFVKGELAGCLGWLSGFC